MPSRSVARASAHGGRKFYSRIPEILEIPNLIDLQTNSFAAFVGPEWIPGATPLRKGTKTALRELFDEISPIRDFTGKRLELSFLDYEFKEPKASEEDARAKDLTFARPLMVNAELKVGTLEETITVSGASPLVDTSNVIKRQVVSADVIDGAQSRVIRQAHHRLSSARAVFAWLVGQGGK